VKKGGHTSELCNWNVLERITLFANQSLITTGGLYLHAILYQSHQVHRNQTGIEPERYQTFI